MRKNFDFTARKHFQRVKLQTIVGLSKLVGKGISDPHNLRCSLATLRAYALASKSVGNGVFSAQVFHQFLSPQFSHLFLVTAQSYSIYYEG